MTDQPPSCAAAYSHSDSGAGLTLSRAHTRRLREVYRSAGWPSQDALEIELLAAGLLQRIRASGAQETLSLTDAGLARLAEGLRSNRAALSRHEALVERVARDMHRAGRIAWRGLSLRALLPQSGDGAPPAWCIARPDVFSIRNTTVAECVDPVVHEIKVSRADLLGDLRRPDKRAAYLDLGGQCWYVLGRDARDRPIAAADEVPAECGVLQVERNALVVLRPAPRASRRSLPFAVWMALAKATPIAGLTDEDQGLLGADLNEIHNALPVATTAPASRWTTPRAGPPAAGDSWRLGEAP